MHDPLPRPSKKTIRVPQHWRHLPILPLALLLVAALVFLCSLSYQSYKAIDDGRSRRWAVQVITATTPADALILEVSYPGEVRSEPTTVAGQPLLIWLAWATPRAPITPTLLLTATTPLSTTPTPFPGYYLVSVEPYSDGLVFTDKEGLPILPKILLTPASSSASSVTFYVRRAPEMLSSTMPLTVSLISSAGVSPTVSATVPISTQLEANEEARQRNLEDVLWGPATPLLVVAIALVSTAVGWLGDNRKQRIENETKGRLAEVSAVHDYIAHDDLFAAARQIDALDDRIRHREPGWWNDPDVIKAVTDAKVQLNQTSWQHAILEEAARLLSQDQCHAARQLVELVRRLDQTSRLARSFEELLDLAQTYELRQIAQ